MELSSHKLKKLANPEKRNFTFLFLERKLFKHKLKMKEFLIVSLIKKQRILKLKIFLKHFFSFFNISFYTQPVYFFNLLGDFCNVHDNIIVFFLFLLKKDFGIFHELFL